VINGQKVFTSGMDISDYCLLVARTARRERKQDGITMFLVDTRLPGIEIRKIDTLGHRAIGTTQVFYNDVEVPADMVIGEVDQGWKTVDDCLWYERLCLSAARTGAAGAAFELALDYAKTREQFGRPIGKFQAISHKLADMKVMLEVSRLLFYRFAWAVDQGQATRHDAAILKLYTSEAYKSVSDMALQIFGGYGYCMEYPMQRFFRDARLAVIGAGSSEIQRNIIARSLGL
jgi:alkylation response protein AidB-like acyl-CoA dehydrogenase